MTIRLSEIQITEVSDTTTGGQTFHDLAVDPNNPNTEVDGRDFLVWQRGYATDDGLLLPAVQDDGLLLPAVDTVCCCLRCGTMVCCCPLSKTMVCCCPLCRLAEFPSLPAM